MNRRKRTERDLVCDCRYHALLAVYGIDSDGEPFIEVKCYKAGKIHTEVYSRYPIQVTCRECGRKHNIVFTDKRAHVSKADVPAVFDPRSLPN